MSGVIPLALCPLLVCIYPRLLQAIDGVMTLALCPLLVSIYPRLLQAIDGVMTLALCPLLVSIYPRLLQETDGFVPAISVYLPHDLGSVPTGTVYPSLLQAIDAVITLVVTSQVGVHPRLSSPWRSTGVL